MNRSRTALLPLALVLGLGLTAAGCELLTGVACDPETDPYCEPCDPETDPYCEDGAGEGTPTGSCASVTPGTTRCASGSEVEVCTDDNWMRSSCATGVCEQGACAPWTTVRIVDQTHPINGQHPGADIDAIALVSGGQTYYATRVTDWADDSSISNRAPDVSDLLGAPNASDGTCDLRDGKEHWYSMAGGEVVVTFDRPIRSGDRIQVFECAGAAQDSFDIYVGRSERLDGRFELLKSDATGTITVSVP